MSITKLNFAQTKIKTDKSKSNLVLQTPRKLQGFFILAIMKIKNSLLFCLLIFFFSCASNKNYKRASLPVQYTSIKDVAFVKIPKHWEQYKDLHNKISFRPKTEKGLYPKAEIKLYHIIIDTLKIKSLEDIVNFKTNKTQFVQQYSKNSIALKSRFGKTFVVNESFVLNQKKVLTRSVLFSHKKKYYSLSIYGDFLSFDDYVNDFKYVFDHLMTH